MKFEVWLKQSTDKLTGVGIGSARLDCLVLLEDEVGRDRSWILAHTEHEISSAQLQKLNKKLAQRLTHEPLAYIRGFSEFYGRKFLVNKAVLEPRPESETMIEELLKLKLPQKPLILDLGTGSGALAITAKLEIPKAEVVASDIDANCLKVARQNAKNHKTKIEFLAGDLLKALPETLRPDVILANLPYVPNEWKINEAAAMEPKIAIFGGPDGLNIYRRFFEQLNGLGCQPTVFTESLPPQHKKLTKIAEVCGFRLVKTQDFIQQFELS